MLTLKVRVLDADLGEVGLLLDMSRRGPAVTSKPVTEAGIDPAEIYAEGPKGDQRTNLASTNGAVLVGRTGTV